MAQNVTSQGMIGYKGMWKGHFHRISLKAGAAAPGQYVRVIHFLWKQSDLSPTGAVDAPNVGTILQNTVGNPQASAQTTYSQYTFLSPYNLQWAKRYTILSDNLYSLSTVGHTSVTIDKRKLALRSGFRVIYNTDEEEEPAATTNTLTGMTPYVMFITDQNTVANLPSITYYSRLSYINY